MKTHSILFVCLGNICRSPAAEGVMRTIVERHGDSDRFEIDSPEPTRAMPATCPIPECERQHRGGAMRLRIGPDRCGYRISTGSAISS